MMVGGETLLEIILFSSIQWKFIMMRCRVYFANFTVKCFLARLVSAVWPSSLTDNLREVYHTISDYEIFLIMLTASILG